MLNTLENQPMVILPPLSHHMLSIVLIYNVVDYLVNQSAVNFSSCEKSVGEGGFR